MGEERKMNIKLDSMTILSPMLMCDRRKINKVRQYVTDGTTAYLSISYYWKLLKISHWETIQKSNLSPEVFEANQGLFPDVFEASPKPIFTVTWKYVEITLTKLQAIFLWFCNLEASSLDILANYWSPCNHGLRWLIFIDF